MNCYFTENEILHFDTVIGAFLIKDVIGKGASSVVYRTIHTDANGNKTEHLLKEYHPHRIAFNRDEAKVLHITDPKDKKLFDMGMDRFEAGYKRQLQFREDPELKNITSNIQGIYEGYGTKFIDMTCFNGRPYDKVEEVSLDSLFRRIKAISKAITIYHKKGFLHLDIKPENIFTFPETSEMIMLFDFDSVVSKSDLNDPNTLLSCTRNWAAPELFEEYHSMDIDDSTDLYSIGMVFFYKLTGRFPHEEEHRSNAIYSFNTNSGLLKEANKQTLLLLEDFFCHTLCRNKKHRWQTADQLTSALDELLESIHLSNKINQEKAQTHDLDKQFAKIGKMIVISTMVVCLTVISLIIRKSGPQEEKQTDVGTVMEYQDDLESDEIDHTNGVTDTVDKQAYTTIGTTEPSNAIIESTISSAGSIPENSHSTLRNDQDRITYAIDTIAYGLSEFRSLIITNDGVVYYIDGNNIFNSANNDSIDIQSYFDIPLENGYLAYDSYHDIVYLLAGGPLVIYDITDLNSPKLVMDECVSDACIGIQLAHNSIVTPEIEILSDGSLLIPADYDGTYRVDLTHNSITKFSYIYEQGSNYYAKVVDDCIIEMKEESKDATVTPLKGGDTYDIQLEKEAPYSNSICSSQNEMWFYVDSVGVCKYDIDGTVTVFIKKEDIVIKDFESLDYTNIWSIAVNENNIIVFYDNTLRSIRCIVPE